MRIGVPKEIKPQENRIGLTPDSVKTLVSEGHEVLIENNGGFEAGFDNDQYKNAGAKIIEKAADIFNDAENSNPPFNLLPRGQLDKQPSLEICPPRKLNILIIL